jgi:hypothetical protein
MYIEDNDMVNFGDVWKTDREPYFKDDDMNINDTNMDPTEIDIDVEYYSIFRGRQKTDQSILEDSMKECAHNKSKEFKLTGQNITKIPEEMGTFDWLETLIIEHSSVNFLNNLPPNITKLECKYNKIEILDGSTIPDKVHTLIFTNNNTFEVVGLKSGLRELSISSNKLKKISCSIPATITNLDLSGNKFLNELPLTGDNLRVLNINDTAIHNIDNLNDNIQFLETCRCHLETIKKLPKDLISWKSYIANIKTIECEFPQNLTELDLFNNSLTKIADLPDTLKIADLSNNELTDIPKFPLTVNSIDFKKNEKLDNKLLKQIEESLVGGKILYDYDITNYKYTNFLNNNTERNGNFWIFNFPKTNLQFNNFGEIYSKSNPHYIPLEKTYCL